MVDYQNQSIGAGFLWFSCRRRRHKPIGVPSPNRGNADDSCMRAPRSHQFVWLVLREKYCWLVAD
jgi:hypothetical protein